MSSHYHFIFLLYMFDSKSQQNFHEKCLPIQNLNPCISFVKP